MAANANTARAQNNTVNDELTRQQGFQKQAGNLFNQSLGTSGVDTAQKTIADSAAKQTQQYQQLSNTPIQSASSPVAVDPVVQARADSQTQQQQGAGAQLQGYNQWGVDQAIKNMLASQQLGVVGSQAQASANTLGPRLQQAGQSQAGLTGLGSILNTLGTVAGVGGSLLTAPAAIAPETAAQGAGMAAGFGPVSAGYAAKIAPQAGAINGFNAYRANPWAFLGQGGGY